MCIRDSIYTDPGTYSVTHAVVSDQGCTAVQIAPASVHVFDEPIADFLISTENPTMINPNVSFTDLSIDPVFWSWNFGDEMCIRDRMYFNYEFNSDW